MDDKCIHCSAIKFKNEGNGICCANGKVKIDNLKKPPQLLLSLLNGEHKDSSNFLTNIRSYNNAFSFTSFGTSVILKFYSFKLIFQYKTLKKLGQKQMSDGFQTSIQSARMCISSNRFFITS